MKLFFPSCYLHSMCSLSSHTPYQIPHGFQKQTMKNLSRRLQFDSSDEDYESCSSNEFRSSRDTVYNEEFEGNNRNDSTSTSTSRQLSMTDNKYSIDEMVTDLLNPEAECDWIQEEEHGTNETSVPEVLLQHINDYTRIEDQEKTEVTFFEDAATKTISDAMMTEYQMISNKIKQNLRSDNENHPDINDLVEYFFGSASRITTVFLEQLEMDYITFLKWIGTILLLQAYRLSFRLLKHDDGVINKQIIDVSAYLRLG